MTPSASSPTAPVFNIAGKQVELIGKPLPQSVDVEHTVPEDFKDFAALRTGGEGFDVVIAVADKKIQGHKALLSARVPFFRGLFDSNMMESASGEIAISQFDYATVSSLLDYVYTGCISISENNVFDTMIVANFLGIEPVMDECASFMRKRIRVSNALPLLLVCRSIGYHKIDAIVLRFIDKNLVSISQTPEFLQLSVEELEPFLRRDSLHVDEETQVFEMLTRWMEDDVKREKHAVRLLRAVRCTRLPLAFIDDVVQKTPWVVGSPDCIALAEEAKEAIRNPAARREIKSFDTLERKCDEAHGLIFPIGQQPTQKSKEAKVSFYDPIANKWMECDSMPSIRGRNGVAVVDKKIYAIGGSDGQAQARLKTCDVYDAETNKWTKMSDLNETRSAMATGVIDGKIYVAGGFNGTTPLATVETMNPSEKKPEWVNLEPMSKLRATPASCVFNGMFYVIGGHNGQHIFNDGEYYNPETNTWTTIAPMKHKRCRFGAAAYNGHIYVAGGFDGAAFLRDVERYDPHTNTWTTLKQMKERRSRASVAVSCGKLYVLGGFDGLNNVSSVEMYQQETNSWVNREKMPAHAGGIFVGTLSIPASFPTPVANLEADDVN